jgi:hypothetical protein
MRKMLSKFDKIEEEYRGYYFFGRGIRIKRKFANDSLKIRECNKINPKYINYCYDGLFSAEFRVFSGHNLMDNLQACKELDKEYKGYCYEALGHKIGLQFRDDLAKCVELCIEVEPEYRIWCLEGLSFIIGPMQEEEGGYYIFKNCNIVKPEVKAKCFEELGFEIGRVSNQFNLTVNQSSILCSKIYPDYKGYCYKGLEYHELSET